VTNASFSARVSRFSFASSFSAAERSFTLRLNARTTGLRERVYRAPVPALCFATRRSRSFVQPVYSEPSRHNTM
jgi:hypothetical protein